MAVKSKADLTTLFADNVSGDISPADLRDFLDTMNPPYASMYISTESATTINTINVWEKAAGTTTDVNLNRFDGKTALTVDNRLKYTGTPDIHVHGVVDFSSSAASANKVLEYAVYHFDDSAASGSIVTHSINGRTHGNTDRGIGACHFDLMLSTNDYVELHVRNTTDATNMTFHYAYLFMMGMMI